MTRILVERYGERKVYLTYLDRDRAQLTSIKLGVSRPGYVYVQLFIFRIARVLLRTPIRLPG